MSQTEGPGSVLSAIRRAGFLDPLSVAALVSSTALWGPNVAGAFGAATARYPGRIAIVDDHGSLTYRQLDRRTNHVAAGLKRAGLKRGAAVGVLCRNHRGFIEANLAAAKLGARPILLNTGLPTAQLDEVITREAISMVVADDALATNLPDGPTVVRCAPEEDEDWSFPGLNRRLPLLQIPRPFDTTTPIILTSGTTGAPKGTKRSTDPRASLGALGFVEAVPFLRGDVTVCPAPLFHAWGFSQMVLSATLAGTIVLRRRFDPQEVLTDLEAHGATVLAAVPVMLFRILEADAADPGFGAELDLSELRVVATSGSALPGDLATRWMDRFGDNLYNLYGSTEVGQVSVAGPQDLRVDPETAGRPMRGITVRILDDNNNEVPTGETGEIMIESASQFDGYTDGNGKRMVGAMMSSGDRGHIDDNGRLFVHGRADDMIISGGENVFPSNIERSLLSFDTVKAAAVVGVEDPDLGQRIRAVVVTGKPATAATTKSLKAHLKRDLAGHEVPREYVYVTELPRNQTGKVLRTALTGPKRSVPNQHRKPKRKSAKK